MLEVAIGWDSREVEAYEVCAFSLLRRSSAPVHLQPIKSDLMYGSGIYRRQTERRDGRIWDVPSQAWAATEFACSRFLAPFLVSSGWVLFADCDMLWLGDVADLFALADPRYAVMCVQHGQIEAGGTKMDGQAQQAYGRKNWSSLMLINVDHPAMQRLTIKMVNTLPGRDLHRFCWLQDDEIGALPPEWNWLEGHSDPTVNPKVVHLTRGGPWMTGWDHVAYAEDWRRERALAGEPVHG